MLAKIICQCSGGGVGGGRGGGSGDGGGAGAGKYSQQNPVLSLMTSLTFYEYFHITISHKKAQNRFTKPPCTLHILRVCSWIWGQ